MKRHHYKLGIIKEIKEKNRQITIEEFHQFITYLNPFFKKFAMIQWFMAGRVGEVAGIQKHRINFEDKVLTIKEVLIWIKGAPKVKDCPKNGEQRQVFINDKMAEIFVDLIRNLPDGCPFLFHKNGNPLRYNMINEHYMRAWKKSGLYPKYSGTHIVRYCSAIHARKISGSLDVARAVTGHKSIKMAEKYACFQDNELNKKTLQDMQEVFSA